jgi:hypothetical protein
MRGLIYGLGAVVALAIVAPAFAGDLTSIEVDPSGKAIGVKKEPGKLAPIPDIGGIPNKGFNYGAVYQVPPNSIDIGKGINVMRGHVDANGLIALHEGPEEQTYVLYVISGTGKMTLNDKDGKTYGDISFCSSRIRGTAGSMAIRRSNSSASTCRRRRNSNASLSARAKDPMVATPLHGWVNGDAAFEFLSLDMPVLRK